MCLPLMILQNIQDAAILKNGVWIGGSIGPSMLSEVVRVALTFNVGLDEHAG